jgi:hypothetical protein
MLIPLQPLCTQSDSTWIVSITIRKGGRPGNNLADEPCRFQDSCTRPAYPYSHDNRGSSGSSESYSVNMTWTPRVESHERVFVSGDVDEKIVEGKIFKGSEVEK